MKITLAGIFMLMVSVAIAQTYTVYISDIQVTGDGFTDPISPIPFQLTKGERTRITFYDKNNMLVNAEMTLKIMKSRRSSSKSTAVKIETSYVCYYDGKKDKRHTEYIIYTNNHGNKPVTELFVLRRNNKPLPVTLTYTISLS